MTFEMQCLSQSLGGDRDELAGETHSALSIPYSPFISMRKVPFPCEHSLLSFSCAKHRKCCRGFREQQHRVTG